MNTGTLGNDQAPFVFVEDRNVWSHLRVAFGDELLAKNFTQRVLFLLAPLLLILLRSCSGYEKRSVLFSRLCTEAFYDSS